MKSLTTVKGLDGDLLDGLIDESSEIRDALDAGNLMTPVLEGICVANVFFEPSTRTRLSFDLAAQRLGAHVITFHAATSSLTKGETLEDSARTIAAIGADIIVVRHPEEGTADLVAEWTGLPVINAGDGTNEHPTQALVDAVTMRRHFGRLEGLRVTIVGDIVHSRVARSLMQVMTVLGAEIRLVGPEGWVPSDTGLITSGALEGALGSVDVVYLLRVQTERGGDVTDDYVEGFQLTQERAAALTNHAVVMHPGPMNRGVEIAHEVAESARCLAEEQVRNGVPVRMAVLRRLAEGRG